MFCKKLISAAYNTKRRTKCRKHDACCHTLDFILTFYKVFANFPLQKETYFTTQIEEKNSKRKQLRAKYLVHNRMTRPVVQCILFLTHKTLMGKRIATRRWLFLLTLLLTLSHGSRLSALSLLPQIPPGALAFATQTFDIVKHRVCSAVIISVFPPHLLPCSP